MLFEKTANALETYKCNKNAEPDAIWELDRRAFFVSQEKYGFPFSR